MTMTFPKLLKLNHHWKGISTMWTIWHGLTYRSFGQEKAKQKEETRQRRAALRKRLLAILISGRTRNITRDGREIIELRKNQYSIQPRFVVLIIDFGCALWTLTPIIKRRSGCKLMDDNFMEELSLALERDDEGELGMPVETTLTVFNPMADGNCGYRVIPTCNIRKWEILGRCEAADASSFSTT